MSYKGKNSKKIRIWKIWISFFLLLIRLPFNWRTPFGYLIAFFVQNTGAFAVILSSSTVLSFLIGSCWLLFTIIRDIYKDLKYLKCKKKLRRCDRNLKINFYHIVKLYLDTKQLSNDSLKILGGFTARRVSSCWKSLTA